MKMSTGTKEKGYEVLCVTESHLYELKRYFL